MDLIVHSRVHGLYELAQDASQGDRKLELSCPYIRSCRSRIWIKSPTYKKGPSLDFDRTAVQFQSILISIQTP